MDNNIIIKNNNATVWLSKSAACKFSTVVEIIVIAVDFNTLDVIAITVIDANTNTNTNNIPILYEY